MRIIFSLLVVLAAAAGGAYYYLKYVAVEKPVSYRTVPITRGELLLTISATGTLQPEEVIDVGAQVAGRIESFGEDPERPGKTVDFNTVVHKGMLLAVIDPTSYKARVEQAKASLQSAEAGRQSAEASLLQMKAKFEQTKQEMKRAESLRPSKAISDTDYDAAVANHNVAVANIAAAEAAVASAEAAIAAAKAMLAVAQTDLGYTQIRSPVEGTIIARRVNIGQTVVASLNAPSIFLIAKDLRRMQVWASVNEADIGRIRLDMPVSFTVDAFPDDTFRGTVTQIRKNAQMTQNVVTYTVIVTTDNSDLKLLPYLTANVRFEVERRENVLLVPNAALRWKPADEKQNTSETHQFAEAGANQNHGDTKEHAHRLWVVEGESVRPLPVKIGVSDGSNTEVSGNDIKEGLEVIVGTLDAAEQKAAGETTTNPFLPKMPKGRRPGPPG